MFETIITIWDFIMFLISICVGIGMVGITVVLATALIVLAFAMWGVVKRAWSDNVR